MNARLVAALLVLLVALGGGAILVYRGGEPAPAPGLGRSLFQDLKVSQVASVSIAEPKAAIHVRLRNNRWTVEERAEFPADETKVREFVVKALELKVGQSEPIGEKDLGRLQLDAGATRVEFAGADGKSLAALLVGKKYFKREPDNPERATADGRFVMLPSDPKSAFLVSDPLLQASAKSADWVSKAGFAIEKVKTLEYRPAAGEHWKIERAGDNADWKLSPIRGGEKLDIIRANSASYSLNKVEIADVAPADAKDTGLDKPDTIAATTLDGKSYTLKVGKLAGANYYVRVAGDPALEGYTLLVAKSKLEDILKKRADLLEKKEAKKKG